MSPPAALRGTGPLVPPAAALSVFTSLVLQSAGMSVGSHAFRLEPAALLPGFVAGFALLAAARTACAALAARAFAVPFAEAARRDAWTWLPLAALALAPASTFHYIGRADLRARLGAYAAVCAGLVLVLKLALAVRLRAASPKAKDAFGAGFLSRPARSKGALVFVAAWAAFAAGGALLVAQGVSFSGDEPHYLLMARSLLHDGDLDLANDYAARDYRAYMPGPVTIERHVVPGRAKGSAYSFHSPGTAFLMLPFYAAGSPFGRIGIALAVRFGMALLGALFCLQLFLLLRRLLEDERAALWTTAAAALTTPVFFYSFHVYPEIPAGLLALSAFRLLTEPGRAGRGRAALAGAILAGPIWFHALKYVFITAPLFLVGAVLLLRAGRERRLERLAAFAAPFAALTLVYLLFQRSLYGSMSLSTVSWKGSLEGGAENLGYLRYLLTGIPFRFRWETLAGYFLDQKDGLILYSPLYAFAFLGFADMLRRGGRALRLALTIALVAGPYVLVSAFLTQRTGYAPQARPLVSVAWALLVGVGWFLAKDGNRAFRRLAAAAAGAGLVVTGLLLAHPYALYQETTQGAADRGGALFKLASNLHVQVTRWLPSYIKSGEGPWWPNVVGPVALVLFAAAYLAARRKGGRTWPFGIPVALASAAAAAAFALAGLFPRPLLEDPVRQDFPGGRLTFYGLSRVARRAEPGRFLLPEDRREYVFTFQSRRPLAELGLEAGAPSGAYDVEVRFFDAVAFRGEAAGAPKPVTLEAPRAYAYGGTSLYWVTVRVDARPGTVPAASPCAFAIVPRW